jgi:hypothetical protein
LRRGRSSSAAADNRAEAGAASVFGNPRQWCSLALGDQRRRGPTLFPGKDGGGRKNSLSDGGARGLAEPESAKTELRDWPDRGASANERRERVFGAGRNEPVARVRAVGPAAEGGGIGDTIRVFERRRRLFPGAVLLKAPPQCLATSQQAIVGVREGKRRQKGECLAAPPAVTATDWDPVVMLIMCLLAASSVTGDRIALTNGTSS